MGHDLQSHHSFPTRRSSDLIPWIESLWAWIPAIFDSMRANSSRRSDTSPPKMLPCPWASSVEKDRKSTRLNSSHVATSYAVFGLKKKNKKTEKNITQDDI